MADIYLFIGKLICGLGGGMLSLAILAILADVACNLWIDASNQFRKICQAESMIFEYRKNRNDFMYWLNMQKETANEDLL